MTSTIDFYNANADEFFDNTVNVDMSALHDRFLRTMPAEGLVLDAGCGSGRDTKAFLERGYKVTAIDGSYELAKRASSYTGVEVGVRTFNDIVEISHYNGIWACASLLHLPPDLVPNALARLWRALKPGGTMYLSFKRGDRACIENGRHFTDANEDKLRAWLSVLPNVLCTEFWLSLDQRPGRGEEWINCLILRDREAPLNRLITGGENAFLPHLCAAINTAAEIEFTVAFVKTTGLRLLLPDLHSALRGSEELARPPARIRFLTSDYLDVTDPEALRLLMLLQANGAEVKVYESAGSSFHMKAYLFAQFDNAGSISGTAFIGSSNISRQALSTGLEWNYKIEYPRDEGFMEARDRFDEIYANKRCVTLTDSWIDAYEARRTPLARAIAPGSLEQDPPPQPSPVQIDALFALQETREDGFSRGLVVLATGLGKTWLAAFDAQQVNASRVLFVAHREEILNQAAETFLRIRPTASIGYYAGARRDTEVDILCASVQTLSKTVHLDRFPPYHFDYVVVDEFHHAAAATYRRLLAHFSPKFLLGLTATPDRSDQSDILSLCDDNLVFSCGLFEGIQSDLLVPFHYYGIMDHSIDYSAIPWRNGKFDPEQLSNKLATLARARHALNEWRTRKQDRTLAFCASVAHATFMASYFTKEGVDCAAVYAGSALSRADALHRLSTGALKLIFSVDLFNEGVDLPAIDTVMMLRPTDSKILFLQQLGRGLRKSEGKEKLVILDFIGNHKSFLHKPIALFGINNTFKRLAEFARQAEAGMLELPNGCYVNYDLELIEFLKALDSDGVTNEYIAMRDCYGRRPTLAEFFRSGASVQAVRREYGSWFQLVDAMGDLNTDEHRAAKSQRDLLLEIETTQMNKCFKMVLLEAFQELDGWTNAPSIEALALRSWQVLHRRPSLLDDLPSDGRDGWHAEHREWRRYWTNNPVKAWIGGNRQTGHRAFFTVTDEKFHSTVRHAPGHNNVAETLIQEIIDYRLAAYEGRSETLPANVLPITRTGCTELPYFPNLKIACGHFKAASADASEYRAIKGGYGNLSHERHFLARASGDSMNGGKRPIRDGDYLLLEHITSGNAGSISGNIVAIERNDSAVGNEYLLRTVLEASDGTYILRANNPSFKDMVATDDMRTLARFKAIVAPIDIAIGQWFMREEIPPLFGVTFNPGNWQAGHVSIPSKSATVLLVTLNKQGKAEDHRYLDHWIDERTFHWQTQNSTTPESKRGKEIIDHAKLGNSIHLFVRAGKLQNGKAAPFMYYGRVLYKSHVGSGPMSVVFELDK